MSMSKEDIGKLSLSDDGKEDLEQEVPTAVIRVHERSKWQRVPFTSTKPPSPPKVSLDDANLTPEATASFFSLLTFGWITSLLGLGYARPLEVTDVYKLQDSRSAARIAEKINASYDKRVNEVKEYNERLAAGKISPGWRSILWTLKGRRKELEYEWRTKTGKKRPSLVFAINDSVKWWFWSAGVLKIISDTAQITTPLVVKALVGFGIESYAGRHLGTNPTPPIGKGIGLVFCLLIMQICASICTHHFFYRAASTGILVRGGLITAIYTRSLRLTTRARSSLPNGRLVNFISTDVSRLDFCCGYFHMSWAGPIQMVVCLVLLLITLGPSALAGYGFFVLVTPIQVRAMKSFFASRKKAMFSTDRRAKLLQELLGGIKIIKFFAWENSFLARIMEYRKRELNHIRNLLITRAANNAVAMSMPALASVLAFVVYSASGHPLDPGIIFAALSLFNLLRLPLMFLPMSLSTIADAAQAITRLNDIFEAELLEGTRVTDHNQDVALRVRDASFTWETPEPSDENISQKDKADKSKSTLQKTDGGSQRTEKIFTMSNIDLEIARGQLVAIVGSVGSGKSSFLQGLIGEMRRTSGQVTFGGTVAYCSQNAFIQNATVRENVCFGRPFESARYWKAIKDACLEHDLTMLPDGDLTEVGERGISLSGGQKQRINICRAIYCDTDIQIFDDPFSALDAHVGNVVFQNVLKATSLGKTRILVTHALHFLPEFDYIYVLSDGRIAEKGTYAEVMGHGKEFARLINEFVSGAKNEEKVDEKAGSVVRETELNKRRSSGKALMQTEERSVGSVSGEIYKRYLKAASGEIIVPLLVLGMCLSQVATVLSSYWLVWWQEMAFSRPPGFYMGIYAVLGVSQTITYFFVMCVLALLTLYSSRRLFRTAIDRVLHAPMSFFETTPLGRIMNRFSKDIDNMDNVLADSLRMFLVTISHIIGAIILVSIVQPWFLIAVAVILVVYLYAAAFYRASARELKRLDAILRSSLYSHFSESLSGLATIRAYGEVERFQDENVKRLDIENRAYWLTVANQRWLGIRLDFLGALLTFTVGMLSVGTRFTISPSQTGVVLSYILTVQQSFGFLVRQSAEVENNMNSVERIVYYGQKIEQEAAHEAPEVKPQAPWPAGGRVELRNIFLNYRPGLPAVLKGVSMDVGAGEKIGIIGRTGAGKSSIMTALYRLVELASGSILIDGVDIAKIGLSDLRNALSIIPQDPLLFSGTLRSNLDPFNLHDDATLWDALKRSYLVPSDTETKRDPVATLSEVSEEGGNATHASVNRFNLDSVIEDEGSNLSIGQRSLVSFARAIVKNSKIIILDEATASVDYETDRNIQDTIAHEFKDRTILCIAHRLRTIISYDRICVLDAGQIAEFDTPEKLFENDKGIFRGMCEHSAITLDDIKLAKRVKA